MSTYTYIKKRCKFTKNFHVNRIFNQLFLLNFANVLVLPNAVFEMPSTVQKFGNAFLKFGNDFWKNLVRDFFPSHHRVFPKEFSVSLSSFSPKEFWRFLLIPERSLRPKNKAQPLPSLQGEGQGWGLYILHSQGFRDPTPNLSPWREGSGCASFIPSWS